MTNTFLARSRVRSRVRGKNRFVQLACCLHPFLLKLTRAVQAVGRALVTGQEVDVPEANIAGAGCCPSCCALSLMSLPMPIPSPVLPAEKNSSVCKSSILKSWKSASGSLSAQLLHNGRAQHFSEAPMQDMLMKHRRSSLLDGIAFTRRGSIVSFSTLADIPASPALPEQFGYMQPLRLKAVAAGREGEARVPA